MEGGSLFLSASFTSLSFLNLKQFGILKVELMAIDKFNFSDFPRKLTDVLYFYFVIRSLTLIKESRPSAILITSLS